MSARVIELPNGARMEGSRLVWNQDCNATSRRTGLPCRLPACAGTTLCIRHGGVAPNVQKVAQLRIEAVRQQLLGMAPQAIRAIEQVLTDPKTSARDRMKAAELILDRAIPTKVDVETGAGETLDLDAEITEAMGEATLAAVVAITDSTVTTTG